MTGLLIQAGLFFVAMTIAAFIVHTRKVDAKLDPYLVMFMATTPVAAILGGLAAHWL